MLKNNSNGFSLIELSMVLALTSAMVVIIFSGQGQARDRVNFKSTINQTVTDLQTIKANLENGSSTKTPLGTPSKQIFNFGVLIEFQGNAANNSSIIGSGISNQKNKYQVTPLYGICSSDGITASDCAGISCEAQSSNDIVTTDPTNIILPGTNVITDVMHLNSSTNTRSYAKTYAFGGYVSVVATDDYVVLYHNLCSNILDIAVWQYAASNAATGSPGTPLPDNTTLSKMSTYSMTTLNNQANDYNGSCNGLNSWCNDYRIPLKSTKNKYNGYVDIRGSTNIGISGTIL